MLSSDTINIDKIGSNNEFERSKKGFGNNSIKHRSTKSLEKKNKKKDS